ncbi:MAG TPA: MlaD family protein, partial [Verrucomicrobiae bacterium]|nr:MlaD family protein [Verrucomicrobiae bacterium]
MNPTKNDSPEVHNLPKAKIKERKNISIIWIVPVFAAIAAGWLVYRYVEDTGPLLRIQFSDGSGIQANQTIVKYHGVRIGEVKSVKLAKDLAHVDVEVRLNASAKELAHAESVFWIVRPEVGAGGFHGLETIVSGPFIQVQPGGGHEQKIFTGADEPPILKQYKKGLEIVLTTPQINTLSVGSPVYYRGIEVGGVEYFLLATNATEDEIHLRIDPSFAPLVRTDTEFWNAGGVRVRVKLTGINISAGTFKSLIIGGIAFATPAPAADLAPAGTVFKL